MPGNPRQPGIFGWPRVLLVRSEMYRNLPFGVIWMSATQMSLSVLGGDGASGQEELSFPRYKARWNLAQR